MKITSREVGVLVMEHYSANLAFLLRRLLHIRSIQPNLENFLRFAALSLEDNMQIGWPKDMCVDRFPMPDFE